MAPYAWIEAASTISIVCLYIENEPEKAYEYTRLLLHHYPANYYFNFLMGEELVRSRRLQETREFLPPLKALLNQSHPHQRLEWELKYASLEAALTFKEGDYEQALERSQWVIDNYDMEFDWHLGFAHLIRGRIREQNGNLPGARDDYQFVMDLDNKTYAVEEAKEALTKLEPALARNK
jgi:tetratricopeptide (TPR) repeat protein